MPTGPAGDKEEGWVGTVSHQREHIPLKWDAATVQSHSAGPKGYWPFFYFLLFF